MMVRSHYSQRRLTENEAFFRDQNQRVQRGLDEINEIAKREGEQPYTIDADAPLSFYCECSDENCELRVSVSLNDCNEIHANKKSFTIVPHHQVLDIERVTKKTDGYWVVEKFMTPPDHHPVPNETSVENV